MATAGQAATFYVSTTTDEVDTNPSDGNCLTASGKCSLRAAIQSANANSSADTIDLPAGIYTLTRGGTGEDQAASGDLDITDSVTIQGATSATTIIDGNTLDRVFHVIRTGAAAVAVSISNVTIRNGSLVSAIGGGLYNNGGTVDIVDSIITGNTVRNATTSGAIGGGIYNNGTLALNGVTLSNNIVDINNSGATGGGGGGIYNTGVLRIENSQIDGNQVINDPGNSNGGGGIQNTGAPGFGPNTTKTVIVNSTISNNTAPLGGGVRNLFGRVDIDLTLFDGNSADFSGGGVQNDSDGAMSILRSTIRNNSAPQSGGGVNNVGTLDINEVSIYGNQSLGINPGAGGTGGGISNGAAGAINLVNTTVSGNQARAGGGLYNHKEVAVTNSTIYDNSITTSNGGTEIFACGSGSSEDPLNTCGNGAEDANNNNQLIIHTTFINSIVGNSTTTTNCVGINVLNIGTGNAVNLINSKGHNIETANTCGFANTNIGDQNNVAPAGLFSDVLGYYGGDLASLYTLPISNSSPAYNAGDSTNSNCPATDERNLMRSDGQCDIGAFEFGAAAPATNVLDLAVDISNQVAPPNNRTVQVTMTFTVVNKGPVQATNVVLTGGIAALPWLKITSLGSASNAGKCTQNSTGFTCTIPTINAYDSTDFYVAVLATQSGKFDVSAYVQASEAENYNPDNSKTVTIDIPSVIGNNVSGNNFTGTSGGGATDWLSLLVLFPALARRLQRRKNLD